ncbi:MAG: SDR family NAD(P)-dependent oxidoreductase [Acidimicrobiaceae bacterium]|nr:SDR family NAD(P)-dependent oxidoreductase [Acidimicrobiaceae bacterium]MCY4281227.1 SDR family NAD(P)-dependent oxidoreductase [Acidimicrobiaceae bacterium]MCY4295114.1 SDR family NAD(P)-dependent oxidoreductase [Acidimicrobiaceae bacterium]
MSRRIALVTGAGSGVGQAAAAALGADGWTVVAAGRRLDRLSVTARLVDEAGGSGSAVAVDVADPESVADLFERIRRDHGRLDLLFNNAGVASPSVPVEEVRLDDWQRVIDVNVTGSFLCARAAFAAMKDQDPSGGRIINNGSVAAQVPRLYATAYTVSKHAITGLTKSLALEGRAFGIACGQIDIGNARTDMTAQTSSGAYQADGTLAAEHTFDAAHAGRAVAHMADLPCDTNVLSMTVMASGMPFVGRG